LRRNRSCEDEKEKDGNENHLRRENILLGIELRKISQEGINNILILLGEFLFKRRQKFLVQLIHTENWRYEGLLT